MNKFIYLLVMSSILFFFAATVSANIPQAPHIRITGEASINAEPDQVTFQLLVRAEKDTALAAKQTVDQRVNALLAELEEFNIAERDVIAAQLLTQSRFEYGRDGQRELAGYEASRSISVTLRELPRMSAFMDYVLSVGIDEIQSIQMEVRDRAELEMAALNLAIEDAKLQGQAIAEQFGTSLGAVYSVDVSNGASRSQYGGVERIMVTGSRVQDSVGQYLQENIEIKAVIQVVFYLG